MTTLVTSRVRGQAYFRSCVFFVFLFFFVISMFFYFFYLIFFRFYDFICFIYYVHVFFVFISNILILYFFEVILFLFLILFILFLIICCRHELEMTTWKNDQLAMWMVLSVKIYRPTTILFFYVRIHDHKIRRKQHSPWTIFVYVQNGW